MKIRSLDEETIRFSFFDGLWIFRKGMSILSKKTEFANFSKEVKAIIQIPAKEEKQ